MMKRILLLVILTILIHLQLLAAENVLIPQVTMETEGEINGKTQYSVSHYTFFAWKYWNGFTRYFHDRPGKIEHFEFETGPSFYLGNMRVDLGFGATTDHRFTAGLTLSGQIFDKPFMFTLDPKWGKSHELFQKIAVSDLWIIRENISLGLRQEMLVAGPANDMLFFRLGPELVLKDLLRFNHITVSPAISPFYDFKNKSAGAFLALRWNF